MSRITNLFERKKRNILNVYCTAGFPKLDSLSEIMHALEKNGADLIEIGMPYSDPLADGPVIQASSSKALANGMTLSVLFEQIKEMRNAKFPGGKMDLPVLLMGYLNPILQYGFERFCRDAAASGVDGLILPDLPIFEFETEYGEIIKRYGLDFVFLVTPETTHERIRKLDGLSHGFIYAVSSSSTTGKDKDMSSQRVYFERIQQMKLNNPVLVGFGIRDKESFRQACEYANGAIIGTAYIKAIEAEDDIEASTKKFLDGILR
jgi:tryptophan synthase alpha chain